MLTSSPLALLFQYVEFKIPITSYGVFYRNEGYRYASVKVKLTIGSRQWKDTSTLHKLWFNRRISVNSRYVSVGPLIKIPNSGLIIAVYRSD